MPSRFLRPLLTPLCLAWLTWAGAAQAATSPANAEALMHESGMWSQLADVAPQISGGLAQSLSQLSGAASPAVAQRFGALAESAFQADALRPIARQVLAAELDDAQVGPLRAWFASPVGQAMTQREAAASREGTGDEQARARQAAALQALPAPRRALIEQLLVATQALDGAVAMALNVNVGIQMGLLSVQPGLPLGSPQEMRAALANQRPQMTEALRPVLLGSFASMYASATDEELRRYIGFLQSPEGRRFVQVGVHALDTAMQTGAQSLGRGLAQPAR